MRLRTLPPSVREYMGKVVQHGPSGHYGKVVQEVLDWVQLFPRHYLEKENEELVRELERRIADFSEKEMEAASNNNHKNHVASIDFCNPTRLNTPATIQSWLPPMPSGNSQQKNKHSCCNDTPRDRKPT